MPDARHQKSANLAATLTFALLAVLVLCMGGCARLEARSLQYTALTVERLATAGSSALDEAVRARLLECQLQQLETEAQRRACVGRLATAVEQTDRAAVVFVAALRAFWIASAAGSRENMRAAAVELAKAAAELPPEYFRGVADAARDLAP